MQRAIVEKVPQVHGYREESIDELIDGMGETSVCRKEKSWTRWNLPGLLGFGMMESGEVWKGPMVASNCALE